MKSDWDWYRDMGGEPVNDRLFAKCSNCGADLPIATALKLLRAGWEKRSVLCPSCNELNELVAKWEIVELCVT